MTRLMAVFFAILLFLNTVYAFETEKKMKLSADGIRELEIECGAGCLEVRGVEGLKEIEIVAQIYLGDVSDEKAKRIMDRKMKLYLKTRGNRAILVSHLNHTGGSFISDLFNGQLNSRIDLFVNMPDDMELSIDDGSGEIEVSHIKNDVRIKDGSGSLKVKNIKGDLDIHDGSGEVDVYGIIGKVDINDGSGTIEVKDVKGDVDVDDGSGYLEIVDVTGDVDIVDGSGSLVVDKVNGNVEIDDGSGSITVEDIERDLVIREAGSGSVNIHRVRGRVERYDE